MNKKKFLFLVIFSLCVLYTKTFAFSGVGAGTSASPYQITTCAQLQEINNAKTSYYILNNDIDCSVTSTWNSGAGFLSIGDSSNPFTGSLDGKGYKISNLYINRPTTDKVGLFGYAGYGYTASKAYIKNIGLSNLNITGAGNTGGIIGAVSLVEMSNVYTTGNVVGTLYYGVGGLIGSVDSSYQSLIRDSYSRVNVTGITRVGGAIGYPGGTVYNVYSTGLVTATGTPSYIGGFVGLSGGAITNSYWDTQTSGTTTSAAGTGKTTSEMKATSTFLGWNFNKVWSIDPSGVINDGYPYLRFNTWSDSYHLETLSGTGTTTDPYIITTCNQLQNIKNNLSAYYVLGNNIDCSNYSYNADINGFYPLGTSSIRFTGVFDGKGYKISNLYINRPTTDYIGLFGISGTDSSVSTTTIKNVGLENVDITGSSYVGGIVGSLNSGSVYDVYTTGLVVGAINTNANGIGGLIGSISSSYNANLFDSYSRADVYGNRMIGGAIGNPYRTISNVYSTGLIRSIGSSPLYIGGFVGTGGGTFSSSYWDTQTSGTTTSAAGTGKTTSEMKATSTFVGWDFSNTWIMNDYPALKVFLKTLNYIANSGGSISGTNYQLIDNGNSGTQVTAVPNTGYHFTSWSDGVLTASRTDTNVLDDKTVTASFAINTYTLTYTSGANGSITGTTSQSVNYGGFGTEVTAVPNTGYHFTSWSDGVLTASRTDLNITGNISVTANFAINTYTVAYTAGSHGSISGSSTQIVNYGGSVTTVTAIPDSDYKFVSWSDGVLTASRTDSNITENKNFVAEFVINQRTLLYTAGSNGSISGNTTQSVTIGQNGTQVTAVPNTGYHFTSWSDGVLTASRTDTNVSQSISVTANFSIDIYIINYTSSGNGSIAGSSTQQVAYNSNGMEVMAVSNTNYHFVSWSDGSTSTLRTDTNVTGNKNLSATFAIDTKIVNYIPQENGSISGLGNQEIDYGSSTVSVTAVPNYDYRFLSWNDGNTNPTRYDSNITENKDFIASFRKKGKTSYYYSCTDFDYTDWSECKNGIQLRTVISFYPYGCSDGEPITERSCKENIKEEEIVSTSTLDQKISTTTEDIQRKLELNKITSFKPFIKSLKFNDTDSDIKKLQQYLNSQGFIISKIGPGSIGNETNYFGLLTKNALVKFQEAHAKDILIPLGLKKGTGVLGRATINYINSNIK